MTSTFSERLYNSVERLRSLVRDAADKEPLLAEAMALEDLAMEMRTVELAEQNRYLLDMQAEALNRLDFLETLLKEEQVFALGSPWNPSEGIPGTKRATSPDGMLVLEWGILHWEDEAPGPIASFTLTFVDSDEEIGVAYKTNNHRWGTSHFQRKPSSTKPIEAHVASLVGSLTIGPKRKLVSMNKVRRVVHELCEHFKRALEPTTP